MFTVSDFAEGSPVTWKISVAGCALGGSSMDEMSEMSIYVITLVA